MKTFSTHTDLMIRSAHAMKTIKHLLLKSCTNYVRIIPWPNNFINFLFCLPHSCQWCPECMPSHAHAQVVLMPNRILYRFAAATRRLYASRVPPMRYAIAADHRVTEEACLDIMLAGWCWLAMHSLVHPTQAGETKRPHARCWLQNTRRALVLAVCCQSLWHGTDQEIDVFSGQ